MSAETVKTEQQVAQEKARLMLRKHKIKPETEEALRYATEAQLLLDAVTRTEEVRQKMGHATVADIFQQWVGQNHCDVEFIGGAKRGLPKECGWIIEMLLVGLAGLGRIEHVDANSELKGLVARGEDRQPALARIEAAGELHARIDTQNLPSHTIDGNPICWLAEVAQDSANTAKIEGDTQKAIGILTRTINDTQAIISNARSTMIRGDTNNEEYQKYVGALSVIGVLYARLGNLTRNLHWLREGLWYQQRADEEQPNPHRLITLATWTLAGATSGDFEGTRADRVLGVIESGLVLAHGLIFHREPTVSSLRQFLTERKLQKH